MKTDWDDLRIILALVRTGSFSAAARRLGVNESTAIRRLAQAEQRFAARLFERRRGGLEPTAAGRRVAEKAGWIEAAYETVIDAITGQDQRMAGSVRLTAVPLLINHILVPALPRVTQRHPEIRLEFVAEPRALSLDDREADIALRLARPLAERRKGGGRCLTRKIADIAYGLYGPADRDPAALPWIGYEPGMKELPQVKWIAEMGGSAHLFVNDAETLLASIRAGHGKSFLPLAVGARQAGLRRLDGDGRSRVRELWLMVHRDLRAQPRVSAVIEWITEVFAPATGPARRADSDGHLPETGPAGGIVC
ncbi:MAG TPA: LysR family transcriptional regulator [Terriglobia bacterium]|nr:LysR family transcriptional regulator [Terriglobia bacterium]